MKIVTDVYPLTLWGRGQGEGVEVADKIREKTPNYARHLRRQQTEAERRIWSRLRDRRFGDAKFRRQHPVGPYITDFCCPEAALVIELDGGQHASWRNADARRTAFLEAQGFRVIRFWDNDVMVNTEGVLERIAQALEHPHPALSLKGRGK